IAQLRTIFSDELEERVRAVNQLLLRLERDSSSGSGVAQSFDALFREAHSLKGAARAVDIPEIEQVAYAIESALDSARQGSCEINGAWFDALYGAADIFLPLYRAATDGDPIDEVVAPVLAALATAAPSSNGDAVEGQAIHGQTTNGAGVNGAAANGAAANGAGANGAAANGGAAKLVPVAATISDDLQLAAQVPAMVLRSGTGVSVKPSTPAGDSAETVRVSVGKLDALLAQAGELVVTSMRVRQRLAELQEVRQQLRLRRRAWRGVSTTRGRLAGSAAGAGVSDRDGREMQRLLAFMANAEVAIQAVVGSVDAVSEQLSVDATQLALIAEAIESEVMAIRLVPLGTIIGPLERIVRDLTRAQGKQARLDVEGEATEIDRKIIEQLRDPLMHMLRNAIDHGLESAEERQSRGKPPSGTISLSAAQRGGMVEIEFRDDGRGLDPAALRQTAVARGVITPSQAAGMDDASALELIFLPGFTTNTTVTDASGRGVGLDVVRENVERLHGQMQVRSTIGVGTVFTIDVPLTLATIRVVLVEAGGGTYAVPEPLIERSGRVREREVLWLDGRRAVNVEGHALPFVDLVEVLEMPSASRTNHDANSWVPFLVLTQADRSIVLGVDRLVDEQEVVIKSLGWPLKRVRCVSGASVLDSGETAIILNPADLIKTGLRLVRSGGNAPGIPAATAVATNSEVPRKRKLLVVDDSLTTRTLERSILESAGYDVVVAGDGLEALVLLHEGQIDLVVSDVEMPRMDGFTLTAELRRDDRLRHVPVVLVTGLDAPEYRERGVKAGADAYIVKSGFDQRQLVETVERLL
ncbi:MAG: two-component system, chemotaxis family, sensor kinase CheA, partial [Chloroflexota bacterium]|nr:two-component system, chemotaxis family, sensor kinase CheA [Chloroflexota bacterium]